MRYFSFCLIFLSFFFCKRRDGGKKVMNTTTSRFSTDKPLPHSGKFISQKKLRKMERNRGADAPQASPRSSQSIQRLRNILNFRSSSVNVSKLEIGPDLCRELCTALQSNDEVTALDLSHNNIGDTGCEAVCNLLQANPNLKSVNLDHNDLTDIGVMALARAARKHGTLESLNLAGNPFQDVGLQDLAKYVANSTSIRELVLTDTQITFQGALIFTEAMLDNTSLLYLCVPFNLGYALIEETEKILKRNWAKHHQFDDRKKLTTLFLDRLQTQRQMQEGQWKGEQSASDGWDTRTKSIGGTIQEWSDPQTSATVMFMHLLSRKRQQEEEERQQRTPRSMLQQPSKFFLTQGSSETGSTRSSMNNKFSSGSYNGVLNPTTKASYCYVPNSKYSVSLKSQYQFVGRGGGPTTPRRSFLPMLSPR